MERVAGRGFRPELYRHYTCALDEKERTAGAAEFHRAVLLKETTRGRRIGVDHDAT